MGLFSPPAICSFIAVGWLLMGCSGTSPADPTQALAGLHEDLDAGLVDPRLLGSPPSGPSGLTDLFTLPSEGTARYTGAIALEVQAHNLAIIGTLSVIANFEGPVGISGRADGFTGSDDRPFRGALYLSNGVIDPSVRSDIGEAYPVTADLDGALADDVHSYAIAAGIGGHFIGAEYNGIAGFADGTVTSNLGRDTISGVFNVER